MPAWFSAFVLLVFGCGPGVPPRVPVGEAQGVDAASVAAVLAAEGVSVGAARTVRLPGGAGAALVVVPEPSDGYPPEVSVVPLAADRPVWEDTAYCDPFQRASHVGEDDFMALDPPSIAAVETWDWDGSGAADLIVTIDVEVEHAAYAGSSARSALRACCAFRPVDDPERGFGIAAMLGWIEAAEVETTDSSGRRRVVERHWVTPVAGRPGEIDYTVSAEVFECMESADRGSLCAPESEIVTRRLRLAGSGFDTRYERLEIDAGGYGGYATDRPYYPVPDGPYYPFTEGVNTLIPDEPYEGVPDEPSYPEDTWEDLDEDEDRVEDEDIAPTRSCGGA